MFSANGLFSSKRSDWRTPKEIYQELHDLFNFNFDPCPSNPAFDGLSVDWKSRNYVNPPYGRTLGLWLKKAHEESQKGKTVVMLLPSRTDTLWWHDYVMKAKEIWLIRGRLKFDDCEGSAPFPSAVVIFENNERAGGAPKLKSLWHAPGGNDKHRH